jgi:hypothetical protein
MRSPTVYCPFVEPLIEPFIEPLVESLIGGTSATNQSDA